MICGHHTSFSARKTSLEFFGGGFCLGSLKISNERKEKSITQREVDH